MEFSNVIPMNGAAKVAVEDMDRQEQVWDNRHCEERGEQRL